MGNESVNYDLKVNGGEAGAAQVYKLRDAFSAVEKVIQKDTSALAQHSAQLKLQAVEQRRAAEAMDKATASATSLERAHTASAASGKLNSEALQKVGSILTGVTPQLGQFGRAVGAGANSAGLLTNVIMGGSSGAGAGPLGIAAGLVAGGVVGALSLWASRADETRERMKMLADMTEEVSTKVTTFADRVGAIQSMRDGNARFKRLSSGSASSVEYEAFIGDRKSALSKAENAGFGHRDFQYESRLSKEISESEQRLANARAREEIEDALKNGGNKTGAIVDLGSGKRKPLPDTQWETMQRKDASSAQLRGFEQASIQAEREKEREAIGLKNEERKEALKREFDDWEDAKRKRLQSKQDEAEQFQKIDRISEASAKQRNQMMAGGMQLVASQGISAFQQMAKGQKVSLGAILESTGDAMVAEGTRWLFTGVANSFIPGMQASGAGLIGVGTAEIAAGMAMGATGASMGAHGGGGGASRSSSRGTTSAEPVSSRNDRGEAREQRSVVQVNVQTLVADERTGERIMDGIHMAHRKLGRRLDPSVVGRAA